MRTAARCLVIAIDGPAGAGKTTVARALAERLGYRVLDTGGMYRALAWSVARAGLAAEDTAALRRHLAAVQVRVVDDRIHVDGHDVSGEIRTPAIGELTSRLTMLAPVREKMTPLQRQAAGGGGVVLEGRDTGTVVYPDADVKFFLDASLEVRAARRHAELRTAGVEVDLGAVRADIAARDTQDRARALAPLQPARDAVHVDTTDLTVDDVVDRMLATIGDRRCCTRS